MQDAVVTAPYTLADALDPDWLTGALAGITGGSRITQVEAVEKFHTVATKQRFRVEWADGSADLCLKAFLDAEGAPSSSPTRVHEHRFYQSVASELDVRIPECVNAIVDEKENHGITIMRDLVADGARFGSALESVSPDQAAKALEQLARLHAKPRILDDRPWIKRTLSELASWNIVSPEKLQELLDGPRGRNLQTATRDANRLIEGLNTLAARCESLPSTAVHGDAHAGNIFWTPDGPGLIDWQMIQRGHWALDVAYQVCAVLPADVAAAHEFALVDHYLDVTRGLGAEVPDRETAHDQYRAANIYGYYLWAVTTRVDRPIIEEFVDRLGKAVERNDSYAVVGM
ncbi:MAG TPA: aminoglycoside phosphotransferase family protein [Novosphingobium sp.]|nr:aminoglycoside phosphotransferase family protein [Novosphingobium sp.]